MPAHPPKETATFPALRALVASIIDYAGLFPPSGLPLDEAIRNFARYQHEPEAWMLARFVIPVRQLAALDPYAGLFADAPPFRFSVLGTGGTDTDAFLSTYQTDLETIRAFHQRFPGQVAVDAMEVRLPASLLDADIPTLRAFLDAVHRHTTTRSVRLDLFLEVPITEALRHQAPAITEAIASHNRDCDARVGFKMRTGGLEPEAFPAAEHLAFAITTCRDADVRFKATAGLHHPLRLFHQSIQTPMYGFLNVFGGAVLAHTHTLDEATLRDILLDDDASHFRFTPDTFAWRNYTASADRVQQARNALAISFGSCSFDEPREDLQALGLL